MLTYLNHKKFIGDLSLQDADILAQYASSSSTILEYGSGGSTQIMSQCGASEIISVETSKYWIQLTQQRISQIEHHTPVEFVNYRTNFTQTFDLIFVDGVWQNRENFAIQTWNNLRVGGVMLFHDTRRDFDCQIALSVAKKFYLEVEKVEINARASDGNSSNTTILHKKIAEPYINWNNVEGKPKWAYGDEDPTQPLWEYTAP
jgi:SAM-dependent methyltransferase